MTYSTHRIFCAATLSAQAELEAFFRAVAEFNESEAMPRGILLAPVAVPMTARNKLIYQHAVEQNIFDARWYVQVLRETWGPPERSFEGDYHYALRCTADPDSRMQEVLVSFAQLPAEDLEPAVAEFRAGFSNSPHVHSFTYDGVPVFEAELRRFFTRCLAGLEPQVAQAGA